MNGYAALDGFPCPCYGVIKRAQTDRSLAPSLNYGVLCHAIGGQKSLYSCGFADAIRAWVRVLYSYPSK